MTDIIEAFEHNPQHTSFVDFKSCEPACYNINPSHEEEHLHLSKLHPKSTPIHNRAIEAYTKTSFNLNKELRADVPSPLYTSTANALSEAIQHGLAPLQHTHHVYAGLGEFNPTHAFEHGKGIMRVNHFISTSIDPSIATEHDNFQRVIHDKGIKHTHILHFRLPEGYKHARYIAQISRYTGEHEMLMDRNQQWKLTDVAHTHGTHPKTNVRHTRTIWSVVPHTPTEAVKELYEPLSKAQLKKHFHADPPMGYQSDETWLASLADTLPAYKSIVEHPSIVKQHNQLIKLHDSKYTAKDNNAIDVYTHGDTIINTRLLTKAKNPNYIIDEQSQEHHKRLKSIFKKDLALDHDVHTYSGIGFNPSSHFDAADGVFHSPAYLSTSLNPQVSWQIAASALGHCHVLHFHLPKGYARGAYFGGKANKLFKLQRELVLDHDQKFKLQDKTVFNNGEKNVHVWHVTPHEADTVKEEVTHDGEAYFNDAHPHLDPVAWTKEHLHKMPKSPEFIEHKSLLHNGVIAKTPHISLYKGEPETLLIHPQLEAYTKDSKRINNSAAGLGDHQLTNLVRDVSEGIKQYTTPQDHTIHTYAGTTHPHLVSGFAKVGDTLHTPTFTSTSIQHTIAKGFGWGKRDEAHHIIHFELPPGYTRGAYIAPHSMLPFEHEYLLDRNQTWKITKHETFRTRNPDISHNITFVPRHVWTVTPHVEKPITEALEHDPKMFANKTIDANIGARNITANKISRAAHHAKAAEHDAVMMRNHAFVPTQVEKESIENYTRFQSEHINHTLISVDVTDRRPVMLDYARTLSKIIHKHSKPLDHEAHVYSGVGFDPSEHFKHGNRVIHMPAFTSASLNTNTPADFGKKFNIKTVEFKKKQSPRPIPMNPVKRTTLTPATSTLSTVKNTYDKHIIHFKLPVGYNKGLYIKPHSRYADEHEFLIDKEQKWKLEKHETVKEWASSRFEGLMDHWQGNENSEYHRNVYNTQIKRHIWTVVPHEDTP